MKIIAESAYNHMGEIEEVIRLMHAAKESGADYFTMQIMDPLIFSATDYAKHQLYIDHNISFDDWDKAFAESQKIGLPIIPCALDENALAYVLKKNIEKLKIHATDLTNPPMLETIAKHPNVKVILETQAATNFEIRFALNIIRNQVEAILTGYSNYPTEYEDMNLDSLDFIKSEYGLPVGLADHSPTVFEVPIMALAKGCAYLEKHITLTRNNRKFDWQVSLYPEEFQVLCSQVSLFRKTLGNGVKHPVANEVGHRDVLYKKVLPDGSIKRSDDAPTFVAHAIEQFPMENVTIGIIARLKSQRLPKKVISNLGGEPLIGALYNNIKQCKKVNLVTLATSTIAEDDELVEICEDLEIPTFRGHAISVIDRLLELAWKTKSGIVLRVTGDNPFTDPSLTDEIISLIQENDLDYAKVNNVPFGVSAEAFSTKYLWDLYLRLENPMTSEYLTWFVLKDDKAKKGSIDVEYAGGDLSFRNLSVDYPQDLKDCQNVLADSGAETVAEISLPALMRSTSKLVADKEDARMKLPGGESMLISEYINAWKNAEYTIRKSITV